MEYNSDSECVAAPLSRPDSLGRIRTEFWMPLKSLHHSKSYLFGSDYKIGQAHKHLHLKKSIYNEGIQAFSKLFTKIDVQSANCLYKISISKRTHEMSAHVGAYSEFSFFMTRRSSILGPLSITIYHSIPAHW